MMRTARAPGRVNLIGEHTDYNQGFVLPMAIDLECRVTAEPAPQWTAHSRQMNETVVLDRRRDDWSDFVLGVIEEFGGAAMALEIDSAVPVGSGLSSSAALEVATALAVAGPLTTDVEKWDLVQRTNKVEREFIGVPVGIMDQFAAVFGEAGKALLLDCRDRTYRPVPLPNGVAVIAVNTMVKHSLGGSAYTERVRECAAEAAELGVASLRDLQPSASLPRRARHVASENQRVLDFAAAAAADDLETLGRLMAESHISLRDDYEVSCAELDFLVERSQDLPGVVGARMTGGGFGGCIVALVEKGDETFYEQSIVDAYRGRFQLTPDVYRLSASEGATFSYND